jgi:transposase
MKLTSYSSHIKNTALEKIQGPAGMTVPEVSEEMGINKNTLYGWIRKSENGEMSKKRRRSGRAKFGFQEKYRVVLEFRALPEKDKGVWLREKGYKEDQLKLWEKEIEAALSQIGVEPSKEIEKELRDTKKELAKKDKALAEVSALLILKKKLDLLMGEDSEK